MRTKCREFEKFFMTKSLTVYLWEKCEKMLNFANFNFTQKIIKILNLCFSESVTKIDSRYSIVVVAKIVYYLSHPFVFSSTKNIQSCTHKNVANLALFSKF